MTNNTSLPIVATPSLFFPQRELQIDGPTHSTSITYHGRLSNLVFRIVKHHHQSRVSIRDRRAIKTSMRRWCRGIHCLIITKINDFHSLNCHLPSFRLWWLQCNKIRTVEMLQFLLKYYESDRTKQQDGCRRCCGEGNRGGPGLAMVFYMVEVIRWRRRKSSWCGSIVTRFFIFWPCETAVCFVRMPDVMRQYGTTVKLVLCHILRYRERN
jgi:hypothetical protein